MAVLWKMTYIIRQFSKVWHLPGNLRGDVTSQIIATNWFKYIIRKFQGLYIPSRAKWWWMENRFKHHKWDFFWPIGLQNSILRLYMSLNVESKKFCHDFIKMSGGSKTHKIKEKHILQKKSSLSMILVLSITICMWKSW